jgi:hypothetical protein
MTNSDPGREFKGSVYLTVDDSEEIMVCLIELSCGKHTEVYKICVGNIPIAVVTDLEYVYIKYIVP